ncbi:MAG: tetratricopeptide repeat protein [Pelagimonas sp.]|jgi:hypothetical protein|nr:tetratricopeptide repeat protein [Pelagimonas sp.]
MSYMTMNMSAPRIWGFDRDDTELRVAKDSGWRRSDLVWERLMEAGNAALCAKDLTRARRLFRQADLICGLAFAGDDPRRAATLASRAALLVQNGRLVQAERLQRRALQIWQHSNAYIERMEIRPRARSSLFHLRMEARHRDTYHDNMRHRLRLIAGETQATLRGLTAAGQGHRHFSRWNGEKPSVHDDTRKILAACLLMPDG